MSLHRIFGRIVRRAVRPFQGRARWQSEWLALHRLAIEGMHIGPSADGVLTSGENHVLAELRPGAIVLDVGANRGSYSVAALAVGAVVHAFEPDSVALAQLQETLGQRVCIHPYGLGDEDAMVPIFAPDPGSPVSSVHRRVHPVAVWRPTGTVRLRPLDDVCEEHGIDRIDLLKLDVEGHEVAALRGARRMIAEGRVAAVQFEFGGAAIDSRTYLRDIIRLLPGFDLRRIVRDGTVPVSYDELMEIFSTTNYIATRG